MPVRRWICVLLCLMLLLVGCTSAFARMIERGDRHAAQGRWDDAAAAYEQAVRLEPEDPEAQAKLHHARRAQGQERLARGRELLAAGKSAEALAPFFEAMRLDPQNVEARKAFEQTRQQVLAEADQANADGKPHAALALARAVLAVLPNDEPAKRIETRARATIAEQNVARGREYEQRAKLAPALLAYAEALVYVDAHPEAGRRFASTRARMIERTLFHVRAAQFIGDPQADELGSTVGAADLAAGLPAGYLLRIEEGLLPKRDFRYSGMRLGGMFRNYRHARSETRARHSCSYVCGRQTVANPEFREAQAAAAAAQSALASAQGRLRGARRALRPLRRSRDEARAAVLQTGMALASAEAALEQCRDMDHADCSALRSHRNDLDDEHDRAEDALREAEREIADAEQAVAAAEQQRQQADAAARAARYQADTTPATVVVDKHCNHDYSVATVSVDGQVEALMRAEHLYEDVALLHEVVHGRFHAQDETFPAVRGKCRELEPGNPLELPAESDVRRGVLASAIAEMQKRILAAYEKERRQQLERSRVAEQDGRHEDAADGALRFLLTATGWGADEEQAAARAARALAVSRQAAQRAGAPAAGKGH